MEALAAGGVIAMAAPAGLEGVKVVCEIHKGNGYFGAAKVMLGEDARLKAECIVKVVNLDADARQDFNLSESLLNKITDSNATSACASSSTVESPFAAKHDLCVSAHHELNILRSLKHPNVVMLFGTSTVSNYLYFYFELLEFGSVRDVLVSMNFDACKASQSDSQVPKIIERRVRGMSEFAIAFIMHGVLQALRYLHEAGIIHRAVQPAHILLGAFHRVVLAGFELAIRSAPRVSDGSNQSGSANAQKRCFDYSAGLAYGLAYAAPELLAQDQRGYDNLCDVYSVGICAAEMWNGVTPFDVDVAAEPLSILAAKARNDTPRLRRPSGAHADEPNAVERNPLQSFVVSCCAPAEQRPNVEQLLKSDWITEFMEDEDADEAERKMANLADVYSVWLADCAQPVSRRARSRDAATRLNAAGVDLGVAIQPTNSEFDWAFA